MFSVETEKHEKIEHREDIKQSSIHVSDSRGTMNTKGREPEGTHTR